MGGGGGRRRARPCARSAASNSYARAVAGVEMKDLKSLADEAKQRSAPASSPIVATGRGRQGEPGRRRHRRSRRHASTPSISSVAARRRSAARAAAAVPTWRRPAVRTARRRPTRSPPSKPQCATRRRNGGRERAAFSHLPSPQPSPARGRGGEILLPRATVFTHLGSTGPVDAWTVRGVNGASRPLRGRPSAAIDPCARFRPFAIKAFYGPSPRRCDAVTAERPERSGGPAKPVDSGVSTWPRAPAETCVNLLAPACGRRWPRAARPDEGKSRFPHTFSTFGSSGVAKQASLAEPGSTSRQCLTSNSSAARPAVGNFAEMRSRSTSAPWPIR